jgi:hypothetical protein
MGRNRLPAKKRQASICLFEETFSELRMRAIEELAKRTKS